MTDKPIIFSAPMIRALLDGRKSQTRRVLKPQPFPVGGPFYRPHPVTDPRQWHSVSARGFIVNIQTLPYAPGDRLWVREAHYLTDDGESEYAVFAADQSDVDEHLAHMQTTMASHPSIDWSKHLRLRPSIFLPRWASRLTLTITDVRVQRVQNIGDDDARAEGAPHWWRGQPEDQREPTKTAVGMFRTLWNSINEKRGHGWDANPWVVALTFDVHRCNIDDMGAC